MTYNDSLAELKTLFHDNLHLDFQVVDDDITYRFPNLRHTAGSPPDNRGVFGNELSEFLSLGIDKFYFDKRTDTHEWNTFILSASSAVRYSKELGFSVFEKPGEDFGYINHTVAGASNWLLNDLAPKIKASNRDYVAIGIGEPGSGKSTLFKYLLNRHRIELLSQRIVFSRFEAMKFKELCRGVKDFETDTARLVTAIFEYLSFILLRDLLFHTAYSHSPDGTQRRLELSAWTPHGKLADLLDRLIAPRLPRTKYTEGDYHQAFEALSESLAVDGLRDKFLLKINADIRMAIVDHYASLFDFVVMFDGLDLISFEDSLFDKENFHLLLVLVKTFARRGSATLSSDPKSSIRFSSVFLLRRNTYSNFFERAKAELTLTKIDQFEIGPVGARAAAINAVHRAAYRWKKKLVEKKRAEEIIGAQNIALALDVCLRYIGASLGLGHRDASLLRLFNGNVRDSFQFIARVAGWMLWNGYESGKLSTGNPKLEPAVEFIVSRDARKMLAQRGYRLVEFLLFYRGPSFESAVTLVSDPSGFESPYESFGNDKKRSHLSSNAKYFGFIDNVFNYHQTRHKSKNDAHCLLEKIRLLQSLDSENWTPLSALADLVHNTFGYRFQSDADFRDVIFILLKGGFIRLNILGGQLVVQRTDRASILLERLVYKNIYLEHVFHRTLFPRVFLSQSRDSPRYSDALGWPLNSIRNVFCFLTYIRFVEDNRANDVSVPQEFRIAQKIETSLWESIDRILHRNYSENRDRSPDSWLVNRALTEVKEMIALWKRNGLVHN
jgi:hypothetical protein